MESMYYLQTGTIIHGRYVIQTVLDEDGYEIIYRAWDNMLQEEVCIKEYYPGGVRMSCR